jgi:hypothetical protein
MNDGCDIKAELKKLVRELLLADGAASPTVTQAWVKKLAGKYGEDEAAWAYDILTIQRFQLQSTNIYHTENGDVKVSNVSQSAGRDIVASAAGDGNMIQAGDISLYNQAIDKSGMNPELATALKDGRAAIAGIQVSEDVMKSVLDNYGKLTIELQKPTPASELVKLFWAPIQMFGKGLSQIVALGGTIAKVCGIPLPT